MSARAALVTGPARGIGAATVRALCADGYAVLALDSRAGTGPAPSGYRFVAVASAAGTRGLFHPSGYGAADQVNTGVTAVAVCG